MDKVTLPCSNQTILKVSLLFLVAFGLLACSQMQSVNAPPTIKIGLVAPFEGLHRPLGYEALFGVKLALLERNQGQGLQGYRVELLALNDFDDPAEARQQARTLIADPEVLGVVGHLSSATTQTALAIYQQAHLATAIPWPVSTVGQNFAGHGIVSVVATEAETSAFLANIGRARGIDKMEKLTSPTINPLADSTQAVELATDGVTAGAIMLALTEAGLSIPVYGQVDVGSPQLVQVAKAEADGLIFVSPAPAPPDVGATAFTEAYQALAGFPPGPRAVLAYDAANVLLDAIEQAIIKHDRRPRRVEVGAMISGIERHGLSGRIAFDQQGRRIDSPIWPYQVSNQEYPGILLVP